MGSLLYKFFTLFMMLVVPVVAVACSGSENTATLPETSKTTPTAEIRVSIAGMITPKETYSLYAQLLDYIAEKTGHPTVLLQTGSYMSVNDLLAREETDVAFLCSGGYVEAYHHLDLPILAAPVVNGQPLYYSYILARDDSGIEKFDDFKGRRFAFSDPWSLTGALYPTWRVSQLGYGLSGFFSDYIYTYNHDNSIKAIKEGVVDGTAVDSFIYEYMKARDPTSVASLKIIEKSPPFGSPPIVTRSGLPKDIQNQLLKVLVEMDQDPQGAEILSQLGIEKFAHVDKSLYLSVEKLETEMAYPH